MDIRAASLTWNGKKIATLERVNEIIDQVVAPIGTGLVVRQIDPATEEFVADPLGIDPVSVAATVEGLSLYIAVGDYALTLTAETVDIDGTTKSAVALYRGAPADGANYTGHYGRILKDANGDYAVSTVNSAGAEELEAQYAAWSVSQLPTADVSTGSLAVVQSGDQTLCGIYRYQSGAWALRNISAPDYHKLADMPKREVYDRPTVEKILEISAPQTGYLRLELKPTGVAHAVGCKIELRVAGKVISSVDIINTGTMQTLAGTVSEGQLIEVYTANTESTTEQGGGLYISTQVLLNVLVDAFGYGPQWTMLGVNSWVPVTPAGEIPPANLPTQASSTDYTAETLAVFENPGYPGVGFPEWNFVKCLAIDNMTIFAVSKPFDDEGNGVYWFRGTWHRLDYSGVR